MYKTCKGGRWGTAQSLYRRAPGSRRARARRCAAGGCSGTGAGRSGRPGCHTPARMHPHALLSSSLYSSRQRCHPHACHAAPGKALYRERRQDPAPPRQRCRHMLALPCLERPSEGAHQRGQTAGDHSAPLRKRPSKKDRQQNIKMHLVDVALQLVQVHVGVAHLRAAQQVRLRAGASQRRHISGGMPAACTTTAHALVQQTTKMQGPCTHHACCPMLGHARRTLFCEDTRWPSSLSRLEKAGFCPPASPARAACRSRQSRCRTPPARPRGRCSWPGPGCG